MAQPSCLGVGPGEKGQREASVPVLVGMGCVCAFCGEQWEMERDGLTARNGKKRLPTGQEI